MMREEYDFTAGERAVFYRPNDAKRFVITLDHTPPKARFVVTGAEGGAFRYCLKTENGETLFSNGPFESKDQALKAVEELRETVLGAAVTNG